MPAPAGPEYEDLTSKSEAESQIAEARNPVA